MNTLKRFWPYIKPSRWRLLVAFVSMFGLALTTGMYAYLVGPLISTLFSKNAAGGGSPMAIQLPLGFLNDLVMPITQERWGLPLFLVIVAVVKGICYFGQFFNMGMFGQGVMARLRVKLFNHLIGQDLLVFHNHTTGQLISKFTNDMNQVELAVTVAFGSVLRDSLTIIVLLGVCFYLSPTLALLFFIVVPLLAVPLIRIAKYLKKISRQSQEAMGEMAMRLYEIFGGIKITKLFQAEPQELDTFGRKNRNYLNIMRKSFFIRAFQSPFMEIVTTVCLGLVLFVATTMIAAGTIAPETLISFFATMVMIYMPIKQLGQVNAQLYAGSAALDRLFAILDIEPKVTDTSDSKPIEGFEGKLQLKNLDFSYSYLDGQDKHLVLKNIDLDIQKGQRVALVGPSGAGKTTLVHLLPRLYDPVAGAILLDGKDIRKLKLQDLRRLFAFVDQEVFIFNDTVLNNIRYGQPDATDEMVIKAAKKAFAHEFINELPRKYETEVGERGVRLSGGQRQRLSIARAFLRNPSILILDEATSSLDSESEQMIQKGLQSLMENRTTLIIAHRLSTARTANTIVVLEQGRVVQQGSHDELVAQEGLYRRLYELQSFSENLG